MLNIPSTVNDPNYRYRMPKMNLKIESKGNGIKTNIVNLGEVAKYLRTDEEYILKFFGFEKASQTTFKEAGGKNNTNYLISGKFTDEQLLKVLDKYIEKYVCCPKCKLPEMHLLVDKEKINGKCDSCPFVGELDNKHKLTAFILKNPPVATNMATGKKEKEVVQGKATLAISKDKKQEIEEEKTERKEIFTAESMEFGSEELTQFIESIKHQIQTEEETDFDIRSAKIVARIKPIGLKKPLIAYALFNTFFTKNINKQVDQHGRLYLNLMKKLVSVNTELQTMLNLQYMFFELYKEQDFTRFLPTIVSKISECGLLSPQFLVQWGKNEIKDVDKNFLFNSARDTQFKKSIQEYLDYLADSDDEEEPIEVKKEEEQIEVSKAVLEAK